MATDTPGRPTHRLHRDFEPRMSPRARQPPPRDRRKSRPLKWPARDGRRKLKHYMRPCHSLSRSGRSLLTAPRTDPYVRNCRIRLLPWIKTSEPHVGIGMRDFRLGKPAFAQPGELGPGQPPAALRASPPHAMPEILERRSELLQANRIPRDRVVIAHPRNTLDSQEPTSARSLCIFRFSLSFSSFSVPRNVFLAEMRWIMKSPFRVVPLRCVKPGKSNVSGGPAPRSDRRSAA